MALSNKPFEEVLQSAIQIHMRDEFERMANELEQKYIEEFKTRSRKIVAAMVLAILHEYSIHRDGSDIVIKVKAEDLKV